MCDNKKSEVVIALYHAEEWCGPCQMFAPIWDEFVDEIKDNKDYKYVKIDCSQTDSNGTCKNIDDKSENISAKLYEKITKFKVNGFPTVLLFVDEDDPKEFFGNREIKNLKEFIESKGKKHSKGKSGGSIAKNAFEEYQEEGNGNFDQCGGNCDGNCDGNKCEFKGGNKVKDERYYEMKYYKYKAKYISLKGKYNVL